MKKLMLIICFFLAGAFLLTILQSSDSPQMKLTESQIISDISFSDHDESPKLGDGAFGTWSNPGFVASPTGEEDPSDEIMLFGSPTADKTIRVKARLEIGHLSRVVLDEEISLPHNQTVTLPFPITNAFSLHQRQMDYATRLLVELETILTQRGEKKYSQSLELRYLVYNDRASQYELMDGEELHSRYPFGLLNEDEQQEALLLANESAARGLTLEGVGSGVFYSATLTREQKEQIRQRKINR